jgi:hypothetical protein
MFFPRILVSLMFALILFTTQALAVQIYNTTLSEAGDTDPQTFHLSTSNVDTPLARPDGTALITTDLPSLYGQAVQLLLDGQDYLAANNLTALGADLSDVNWSDPNFPALGQVAIDPATGRVKFAKTWSTPQQLNLDVGSQVNDTFNVVMNASGYGFCTYYNYLNNLQQFYVHQYVPGTGWGVGQIVDDPANTYSSLQSYIGMADSGLAVCVWDQYDGSDTRMWANTFADGDWHGAQFIGTGTDDERYARFKMNKNGQGAGVWFFSGTPQRIYGNLYKGPLSGWDTAQAIDNGAFHCTWRDVFVNDSGDGFALIRQENGSVNNVLYVNHLDVSGPSWSGATLLSPAGDHVNTMPIGAISNSGTGVCIYVYNGDNRLKAHIYNGTSWGASENIDALGTNDINNMDVEMDDLGNAICVFQQNDGTQYRIYAIRYTQDSGWGTPARLDLGMTGSAYPKLSLNANGEAVCAFLQYTGGQNYLTASHFSPSTGWSESKYIDTTAGNAYKSNTALNDNGQILVAYKKYVNTTYQLYGMNYDSEIPSTALSANYQTMDLVPTATPLPTVNDVIVTNRKIEPLQGEATSIRLDMITAGRTTVKVYTLNGILIRTLKDEYAAAGSYTLQWAAQNAQNTIVASGVYLIHVKTPNQEKKIKVGVIK